MKFILCVSIPLEHYCWALPGTVDLNQELADRPLAQTRGLYHKIEKMLGAPYDFGDGLTRWAKLVSLHSRAARAEN